MKIEINSETARQNPNLIGELLRDKFFAQDRIGPNYSFGCYSTFEYRKGVEILSQEPVPEYRLDEEDNEAAKLFSDEKCDYFYNVAKLEEITCKWYWDGDGTLLFVFPDGSTLENSDCKKDYNWNFSPKHLTTKNN